MFCSVWSGDPDRHDLLRGHAETLQRQTAPMEAIYVFDDGDRAPDWVVGTVVSCSHPLTIYQAWNVAVQVATTEFVMNLNLDDRLAPEAVSLLEDLATGNRAGLAGGDWNICYSQRDTDATTPASPARGVPFEPAWPPLSGTPTRLGSGTGERGTMGPATLWRRDLHDTVPFPWLFGSGAPIQIVGDLAWWTIVGKHLDAAGVRLPLVIGNYHSHPQNQAEFRHGDEHETLTREGVRPEWYPLDDIEVQQVGI